MAAIFECEQVNKAYGGLLAVKDVTFSISPGEIFAIVGPNGAGKTTLFDTISGVSRVTSGIIRFEGREIQHLRPDTVCRLGVVRTFQTTVGFDTQTVLANVLVGGVLGREGTGNPTAWFSRAAIDAGLEALDFCDLIDKQGWLASALSVFERKRLMLATALATQPKLLLLDEPVGGLNRTEREEMVNFVRKVNQAGITILMIEHVMKAVQALATRMLVLHHGQKIAEGPPAQVLRDEKVVEVYLGGQGRRHVVSNNGEVAANAQNN